MVNIDLDYEHYSQVNFIRLLMSDEHVLSLLFECKTFLLYMSTSAIDVSA